jgi:hypothetical protein
LGHWALQPLLLLLLVLWGQQSPSWARLPSAQLQVLASLQVQVLASLQLRVLVQA